MKEHQPLRAILYQDEYVLQLKNQLENDGDSTEETQWIAIQDLSNPQQPLDELRQVQEILLFPQADYCWLESWRNIEDELMALGNLINKLRVALPESALCVVSALPSARSIPRADAQLYPQVNREKYGDFIAHFGQHTLTRVQNCIKATVELAQLHTAATYKSWNQALAELLEIKKVDYINLYESGLLDEEGWLREEYTAPEGYGRQLNEDCVRLLGAAINQRKQKVKGSRKETAHHQLYASCTQRSIDPPLPCAIQGQMAVRIAHEIKYPLFANIALFHTEGQTEETSIWVSLDLSVVMGDLQEKVMVGVERMGLPRDHVFLCAMHTHDAPFLVEHVLGKVHPTHDSELNFPVARATEEGCIFPKEYTNLVAERVLDGIREAWDSMRPAFVGAGTGYRDVGNPDRGFVDKGDGAWGLEWGQSPTSTGFLGYYNDIPGDRAVEAMGIWDQETKQLRGMVAGIYSPAQTSDNDCYVSSDLWHFARERLRTEYGLDVPMVTLSLTSGDCGPAKPEGTNETRRQQLPDIGYIVADGIAEGMTCAKKNLYQNPGLRHERLELRVPLFTVPEPLYQEALAHKQACQSRGEQPDGYFGALIDRYELQQQDPLHTVYCHCVRLGETAIGTFPFEMDQPFGRELRGKSNYGQVLPVQLTDNYYCYLHTTRLDGIVTMKLNQSAVLVAPEGGYQMVNTLSQQLNAWKEQ